MLKKILPIVLLIALFFLFLFQNGWLSDNKKAPSKDLGLKTLDLDRLVKQIDKKKTGVRTRVGKKNPNKPIFKKLEKLAKEWTEDPLFGPALKFAKEQGLDPNLRITIDWRLSLMNQWKKEVAKQKKELQSKKRGVDFSTGKIVDLEAEEAFQSVKTVITDYERRLDAMKHNRYLVFDPTSKIASRRKMSLMMLDMELNSLVKKRFRVVLLPQEINLPGRSISLFLFEKENPIFKRDIKKVWKAETLKSLEKQFAQFNQLKEEKRRAIFKKYNENRSALNKMYQKFHLHVKVDPSTISRLRAVEQSEVYRLFVEGKKWFDSKRILFVF